MAGGIDWFRWHHGTVNDQKFPLVARKSGASVAEVIAVWACLLERASQAEDRGAVGAPDFEAMDCALGMDDGKSAAIFAALQSRDLIDESSRLKAWASRQPKKEDESAADRKRAQREREAAERDAAAQAVSERDAKACHAMSRDVTLEESREEKNSSSLRSEEEPRKRSTALGVPFLVEQGCDPAHAADWLKARGKNALTATAWEGLVSEANKAGITPARAVHICALKSWRGFEAAWDWPGKPATAPPSKQSALEARNRATALRVLESLHVTE